MRRILCAVTAAVTLAGVGSGTTSLSASAAKGTPTYASTTHASAASGDTATYLVVLRQAPAASYQGGITGLHRTMPGKGQRFDDQRPAVAAYRTFLATEQARLLGGVGSPPTIYSYTTALDGFAARLTTWQAQTLAESPDVLAVQPDTTVKIDDSRVSTGAAPATDQAGTIRTGQGTGAAARDVAGRGVVIGVVDTGVWPDNPSLAGIPVSPSAVRRSYPGFTGECEPGAGWASHSCGSKVLAAQFFVSGFGTRNVAQSDYLSARDAGGHGTSAAAVAAGNAGVVARIAGQAFGHISGMAPAAGLSIYKACWTAPDPSHDGCDTADTVAAIDRAVRDGVDVLNYSIGGTRSNLDDAVELAFLNAAAANVSVVTSAGNGGPAPGSVQHPSPWVTTVGANSESIFQGGVRIGDGRTFVGAMLSDTDVARTRLVYAGNAALAGVSRGLAARCAPDSLDARSVDGAIVVCDRGVTSRVSKGTSVDQAGGAAMVLVNTRPGSVDADLHRVPTVHLAAAAGRQVKAYIARAGSHATGQIVAGATNHPQVPAVARFSSRGPSSAWSGDLAKPDLTAPGVSVVSATSPVSAAGLRWDVVSGTSIAAAHVAGVAADLRAVHPTWGPALVKSAMMTTATAFAGAAAGPARGAGEVDPTAALEPGLGYDSDSQTWAAVLSGDVDPSSADLASISVGDLVGQQTVRRTVTNVGRTSDSYTATVRGLRGVATSVTPSTITVAPGRTATYTVAFTATRNASYDAFTSGSLTWRDDAGHTVTSPLSIRPQVAAVPSEITATGRGGSARVNAVAGVTGTVHVMTSGLVGARPTVLALRPQAFDPQHPDTSSGTAIRILRVPPGSRAVRFQATTHRPGDDVELFVYHGDTLVESATDAVGTETVTLSTPTPGTYAVYVTARRAARGGIARAVFTSWVLPGTRQPGLDVAEPAITVTGGERFAVDLSWAGLDPRQRWWGYVAYRGLPDRTYLTLN